MMVTNEQPLPSPVQNGHASSANGSARRPATVYRYFDSRGVLLYIGVTVQGPRRQRGHGASAPWWPLVATATFRHYTTVRAALDAERKSIRKERPVWNKQHRLNHWLTLEEGVAAFNAMWARQRGPYTPEQIANALGLRADLIRAELERHQLPARGGTAKTPRWKMDEVVELLFRLLDD